MTVQTLIELLKKEDPNRIVIIQKDSEGNGYSPLADLWTGAYEKETSWYGEVKLEELTDELIQQGYSEDDISIDGAPCIVFCPVN